MNTCVNQLAVIMARGESRRMGHPKGLCQLNGRGDFFVTRIIRLYHGLGIPTLLVARPEDEAAYGEIVVEEKSQFHTAAGGGDTAQTMKLAMAWAASHNLKPDFYWAHPVDLPLVNVQTIQSLLKAAEDDGDQAWRPVCNEIPGHPVLIPEDQLSLVLAGDVPGGSMSKAWKTAIAGNLVPPMGSLLVDDTGAITDFDTPEQLSSVEKPKVSGS